MKPSNFFVGLVFVLVLVYIGGIWKFLEGEGKEVPERMQGDEGFSKELVELKKENEELRGKNAMLLKKVEELMQGKIGASGEVGGGDGTVQGVEKERAQVALVIFTYKRVEALNRSLEAVFKYKGEAPVDVIISQDDDEAPMTEYLSSLKGRYPISHIQHKDRIAPTIKQGELVGYYYISQHYKFALEHAFSQGYEFVIILEEDIEIAPDFFPYFFKLKEVLELDPTVFCISAWNDNGRPGLVSDAEQLYRTDFFPGLGWMMKRSFWEEVKNNWPAGYWDDWLREPQQRKGRVCIYPEVSRTYTFGLKDGTSQGQFADKYLKPIILNQVNVPWMQKDVSYLLKQNYDPIFLKFVKNAKPVAPEEISNFQDTDLLVEYKKGDHVRSCDTFEIMNDEKVGVLRTSYMDVVIFRRNSNRIFLAPTGFQNEISLK